MLPKITDAAQKILWHVRFGRGAGRRLACRVNKEGRFPIRPG